MSTTQDHNCIFCKESFCNKEDLQIHFRKHGDPKFNQGMKCSKISNEGPNYGSGDKSEDSRNDMVSCDVCTEVFPTISKAITHKHKVHPDHDAKYFCPWCGKLFTMKHLYNKHIENNHDGNDQSEESGFHCDSCEVDFFIPSAMVYHNKFFHRQDTELAAIGHSKKMKLFNQEPLLIYYCPFCGEEYFNKVNLHKHMRDDHSDENQSPDDILRCPLCEAMFYHLDAYELHLTFHSSDDLYSEENEIARDIMEFSLETVPPIMEKVENEADNGTANSIGIEELLQQAMNESNDNDNSNSEGLSEKKKKRKKHKKKKTITLDEFLNMNKDVFGEGLGDVQGIEEVPTQIVAKQLKPRKPPKIVVGSKIVPTAEIEKLKKQGIVVKKKLNQPHQFEGIKVMHSKPMNLQNVKKANKVNPTAQKSKQFLSSSNDVLAKLQNSQIKIVKKGAQNPSTSETLKIETSKEAEVDTGRTNSLKTCDIEETENATSKDNEQKEENFIHRKTENSNKAKMSPKYTAESNSRSPECENLTNPVEDCNQHLEEESESPVHFNNKNSEKNIISEDHKGIPQSSKPTINSTDTFNALKNLSQHITIKPMSSPNSTLNQQKSSNKCNDECQSSDVDEDEIDSTNNKEIEFPQSTSDKKSLNALIHLSHLTVKSVNQTKSASSSLVKNNLSDNRNSAELDVKKYVNSPGIPKPNKVIDTTKESNVDLQQDSSKPLNAMKNISKHVTIKSLKQSPKSAIIVTDKAEYASDNENQVDDDPNLETNTQNEGCIFRNKNLSIRLPNSVTMRSLKSPVVKSQSPSNSPKLSNRFIDNENHKKDNDVSLNIDEATKQTCTNILKQLPNITAKPLNCIKNAQPLVTINTPKQVMNMQKCNFVQKLIKNEETKEEIEIFNIEDSDEEEVNNQNKNKNEPQTKPITSSLCKIKPNITNQKLDALRNLHKNITIKSTNQLKSTIAENSTNFENDESNQEYYSDYENENVQIPVQRTTSLNNTLRHLGKHITVVSSSPKTSVTSGNKSTKTEDVLPEIEEYDSEPEVNSQDKIAEIDHGSYEEIEDTTAIDGNKVVVRTPTDSDHDSDHETAKGDYDEDIESQITTNILTKQFQDGNRKPDCLSNLKNITIKSLKDMNCDDEESDDDSQIHDSVHDAKHLIPKFGTQMSVKPFKQMVSDSEAKADTPVNKNMKQQVLARSSNQSVNQKVSTTSPDQVNAVNKEVTIQTFQTKTVIQEITTTVTKTIRTLNQTVKQEVRNTNQNTSTIRPQRVQGIRPNQQINNFQGTQVRTAMPTIRPRVRSSAPANRPVVGSFVRSPNQGIPVRGSVTTSNQLVPFRPPTAMSNQLVPVRPGLTVRGPRMPVIRKPGPPLTCSAQRPVLGKPLKISPTAMTSNKRPISVDTAGPFSCFKKPKESPIPTFDDSDSPVHFASSSQTSRSNFSSITKTVKDNSLVTSSHMSSEVSASMQQINNLSNMSGIKVVKTSKAKQTMQIEERSDVTSTKRSALEAIERLQKQGVLVKKPRVEEHDSDHEHFDSGGDDDEDCYDNT